MGIFNFYSWYRKQFSENIYKVQKNISEAIPDVRIDNLLIDCNGLFHTSAQKVFKYGSYKPPYEVLIKENKFTKQEVYNDICQTIENLLFTVNPTKRLILCVDGTAPASKMTQQRKRRFKAASEREEGDKTFDSNCLTPGTEFMDHLSKYIEWFIRQRISENPLWQDIEVVYSSSFIPSEGEQKLMSFIRKYGKDNESYIIHGLDADLIMLSLLTHFPKFYVLRDDTFDRNNNYLLLDIGIVRKQLIEEIRWESTEEHKFNEEWVINDFVFLSFLCGNDFLPHIPSIEIIEGGIEVIIQVCKSVGETHGHITRNTKGNIVFCKIALGNFLEIISESEKELFEQKYKKRARYFPDETLDKCASFNGEKYCIDIEKYRVLYNEKHFKDEKDIEKACNSYLVGLQWILTYYTKEVPSWKWFYPYHYAPTSTMLLKYISSFQKPRYHKGIPSTPFLQLLTILPPKSSHLLPKNMSNVLNTHLKKFCPDKVEVDLSGKKQEYQGIVLLPFVEQKTVQKVYDEYISKLDEKDLKRNIIGKSVIYKYSPSTSKIFYSYYGNIPNCMVEYKIIEI